MSEESLASSATSQLMLSPAEQGPSVLTHLPLGAQTQLVSPLTSIVQHKIHGPLIQSPRPRILTSVKSSTGATKVFFINSSNNLKIQTNNFPRRPRILKPKPVIQEQHYEQPQQPQHPIPVQVVTIQQREQILKPSGTGPGNLSAQVPGEKRLVRKFCFVRTPTGQVVGNTGTAATTGKPNVIPLVHQNTVLNQNAPKNYGLKPDLQMKTARFKYQEYNREYKRFERILILPNREVRVTEATIQTDPEPEVLPPPETSPAIPETPPAPPETPQDTQVTDNAKRVTTPDMDDLPLSKRTKTSDGRPALENLLRASKKLIELFAKNEKSLLTKIKRDFERCNIPDEYGNIPLHAAVITRNARDIIRQGIVLKNFGKSLDRKNSQGLTPLQLALISNCDAVAVRKLVKLGASINVFDGKFNSVIHLAVKYASAECLNAVLKPAVKLINNLNDDGLAPLHVAVMQNKAEHVKLLLSVKKINMNLPDARSGRTALFHSLEQKHHDLARLLLSKNANKEVCNFAGQSLMTMTAEAQLLKGFEEEINGKKQALSVRRTKNPRKYAWGRKRHQPGAPPPSPVFSSSSDTSISSEDSDQQT